MALTVRKIFAAFAVIQVVLSVRIGDDQPAGGGGDAPAKPAGGASKAKPPAGGASKAKPPAGGASKAKPPPPAGGASQAKPPLPAGGAPPAAPLPAEEPAWGGGFAGESDAPASEDMCDGTHQSPIDIISVPAVPANGTDLLQYMAYNATDYWRVVNYRQKNKSFGVIGEFGTLNLGLVEYSFGAIHFHFPSEHTIDNKTFAGEMQLMHSGPNGSKAIVSILFEEDEVEENDFLTTISEFATLSKPLVGNGTLSVLPGFEEQLAGSYYSYAGSITSPPCTEGVEWYIMQETARVSAEQILAFTEAFGGQTANRELQPLNDRTVCFNTFANECLNMSVIGEEPEGGEEVPVEVPEREPIKVCAAVKKPSCEECNKYTATDKKMKEGPDCWYVASEGKCASEALVKEKRWIVPAECQAAGKPAPPAAGAAGAVPGAGAAPADGAPAPEGGAAPAPEGGDAPAPEAAAPAPEGGDAPAPEAAAPAPEGGDAPAPEGEAAPAPERKKSIKKMA